MCEHPFIVCKAGALFCEECGLFLPAYPEQMAKDNKDAMAKAIDAVVASALPPASQALQSMTQAMQNANQQLSAFQKFTGPLVRQVYTQNEINGLINFQVFYDEA